MPPHYNKKIGVRNFVTDTRLKLHWPTSGSNPDVRKMCEERISAITSEIAHLKSQIQEDKQEQMPLDFALGVVREFVERPLQIWRVGGYKQQQGVLNLCFEEPIYYERGKKFRTPKLSPIFAVLSKNSGNSEFWRTHSFPLINKK